MRGKRVWLDAESVGAVEGLVCFRFYSCYLIDRDASRGASGFGKNVIVIGGGPRKVGEKERKEARANTDVKRNTVISLTWTDEQLAAARAKQNKTKNNNNFENTDST